jgi:hypothetical protein
MTPGANRYKVHKHDEQRGRYMEETAENPLAGFICKKSEHEDLIDENLSDVMYYGEYVYRIFWNKRLFASQESLTGVLAKAQILALVYLNDYKEPMVWKTSPAGGTTASFTGYWHRGRVVGTGVATLAGGELTLEMTPQSPATSKQTMASPDMTADQGSLCGGSKQPPPPPTPGPDPKDPPKEPKW